MAIMDYDGGIDNSKQATPVAAVPTAMDVNDVNKLGMGNEIQYTKPEPPPEPNLGERVTEDVEKPFIQTQHTVGAGISWLGDSLKDETPFGALGDRISRAGIVMQERAEQNLKDNFSNFTPNMMDNIVGAVPTIAGYLGAGAALAAGIGPATAAAVTTGVLATAGGLGIGAEEYSKFKAQGLATPQATALAAAIGVPAGGVMALGFGMVGKIVEPWFGNMLKGTIGKIIGDTTVKLTTKALTASATGAVAFGAQGVVQDTGEFATGAQPRTADSALNDLGDIAQRAIYGGVLAGGLGLHFAVAEHNKLVDGFQKIGMDPRTAQQTATDVLGQGAHVMMDAIEKHLKYTADEQARIQTNPAQGEVRPNILDRSHVDLDQEYVPHGTIETTPDQISDSVVRDSANNKYVKLGKLNLKIENDVDSATGLPKVNEKITSENIRYQYVGERGQQLLKGANLHSDMETAAPGEGSVAFIAKQYSPEELTRATDDTENFVKEKLAAIKDKITSKEMNDFLTPGTPEYEAAVKIAVKELTSMAPLLNAAKIPSEGVKQQIEMANQYYQEAGDVATKLGTIHNAIENYVNRVYKPETPQEFIKIAGKGGIPQFTYHSLARFYDDPLMAIAAGKRFATMDLPDLVAIHNQEMTPVNYGRQLCDKLSSLPQTPLGKWIEQNALPIGWKKFEGMTKDRTYIDKEGNAQLSRQVFASPKGIHDGLKALVEPDWFRTKIPGVATAQDIQAYIKTGWLGLSVYHDITFATQTLSSAGGLKTLADLPKAITSGMMETSAWREKESAWVGDGLTTPAMSEVQDIRSGLEEKGENWDKFLKTPIVKQLNEISEAHTKFLFGPYQRWIKVETASKEYSNWQGKHPTATEEESAIARRGIAKTTNDEFGGQNWEALGVSKTQQSMARLFLLAPDWVMSMAGATKSAASSGGAEGTQARGTLFKAVFGALAIGEGLNHLITGHWMKDNSENCKWGIEISPDVCVTPVRGAPGELFKLVSNVLKNGLQGAQRYAENKASPFASTAIMLGTGADPSGGTIWKGHNAIQKSVNGIWTAASHDAPIPFNITQSAQYMMKEPNKTPQGLGAVLSGGARYSPPANNEKGTQLSPAQRLERENTRRANKKNK